MVGGLVGIPQSKTNINKMFYVRDFLPIRALSKYQVVFATFITEKIFFSASSGQFLDRF